MNSSQHAQLDELMRVVSALEAPRRPPATSAGLATARRTKTTPKGGTTTRPKKSVSKKERRRRSVNTPGCASIEIMT
ncbi:hypothetical protein [Burkholderia ubonensis]|uniref:hypothetical protein n=1 Tax=Burkholderia ubonensis TaxID=101571 RepID=UPI0039F50CEC